MTNIVTINGRESIWLLADRRLSIKGRAPKDDARKVMFLETKDGQAILGYAGLGATAFGTEPADWMSSVLRGRNLPLEQSLGVLAEAMKKQLPRHMARMPGPGGPSHNVVATAFLGDEVRVYTIDLALAPDRKSFQFRYARRVTPMPAGLTPRVAMGGSGVPYLQRDRRWKRPLLRLINAYDRGQVSGRAVANHLASLNYQVHQGTPDQSVGPTCIVAWRNRKSGFHKGGGGHQFYIGETLEESIKSLPEIGNGMDINAMAEVIFPKIIRQFTEWHLEGGPLKELDKNGINAKLARLPSTPDENLR